MIRWLAETSGQPGVGAVVGIVATTAGVYLSKRLIDWLLPSGRHFRAVERYAAPDETDHGAEPGGDE